MTTPALHFQEVMTELGWCYTFNGYDYYKRNNGSLQTYSTGASQGLYLRLNVNQSESYYGPSSSAGFKVRLN